MTEELKTLKDLSCEYQGELSFAKGEFKRDLKAEAVKWVKKFNKEINSAKSTKKIDRLVYGLEFLKHFFNLTEEDLKDVFAKSEVVEHV